MDAIHVGRTPKPAGESNYRWVILAVSLIAQVGAATGGQVVPAVGSLMQDDLGLSRAQVGLFQTALAGGQVLVLMVSGLITDRVGIRLMYLAGMAVTGIFLVGAGVGGSYVLVLATFVFVGMGSALTNPATAKAIMYWFLPRIRATAMSIKQSGVPVSGVFIAAVMPSLALSYGWRAAIAGLGAAIVALGLVCFVLYREHAPAAVAKRPAPSNGLDDMMRLLRRREVLIASFTGTPLAMVQFSLVTYVILYLKEDFSYSLIMGGVILSLINFAGIGGRVIWGLASDYFFHADRRATLLAMIGLSTVVMAALVVLPDGAPFWVIALIAIASGATTISWNGVWMTQATELAGKELAGSVSGIALTLGQFGILIGPPLFGAVVDGTGSYRIAWLIMVALSVVGFLLLVSLRPRGKEGGMASGRR